MNTGPGDGATFAFTTNPPPADGRGREHIATLGPVTLTLGAGLLGAIADVLDRYGYRDAGADSSLRVTALPPAPSPRPDDQDGQRP